MQRNISTLQAVIALTLCQLFGSLLFTPLVFPVADSSTLLYGSLLAIPMTAVLLLPAVAYWTKHPKGNLLEDAMVVHRWFGKGCLLVCILLLWGEVFYTVVRFHFFITIAIFPNASSILIIGVFLLAAVYGASMGLEGLVRAGSIIGVLLLLRLVFVEGLLVSEYNFLNLRPLVQQSVVEIFQVAWQQVGSNVTLLLLLLLLPRVPKKRATVWGMVLLAGVLSASAFSVCVLVLGDYLQLQSFPFYSISSIAQTDIFQRMDAMQMALSVLVSYLKLALYLLFTTELLQKLFPVSYRSKVIYGVVAVTFVGSLGLAWYASDHPQLPHQMGTDIALLLVLVVVPIILLCRRKKV